jgi:hypothetical protein
MKRNFAVWVIGAMVLAGQVLGQDSLNVRQAGILETYAQGIVVLESVAYVAGGCGLQVIDISNPYTPTEIGRWDSLGQTHGIAVDGNYAYLVDYESGLRVIDISDPANPVEIGFFDTPGYAVDVAVSGNYAFVADDYCGLRIIDVANPNRPTEAGYFDTEGPATHVAGLYPLGWTVGG